MGCIECLMFLHTTYFCDKFNLGFSILYPHLENNIEHISDTFEYHGVLIYICIYVYLYIYTKICIHKYIDTAEVSCQ